MSAFVLGNAQLLFGGMELGPFSGEFDFGAEAAMKVGTNFGSLSYKVPLPGLTTSHGMVKGFSDYATGAVSVTYNAAKIGTQQAFGIVPNGSAGVAGDNAQFMRGVVSKIAGNQGAVGEINTFELDLTGDAAPIDGVIGAPLAARTTAGLTGTSIQLGAVPAGKRLYAAQWVTAATGTNLATTIQSDNATGFPSTATALTFSTVSATGWQYASVAGPLTDDWYRVVSTIATNGFTYAVLLGIQ